MWTELVKVAILGTDRTEIPAAVLAELQSVGIDINESPDLVLARGLAYFRMLTKAAGELPVYEGELPAFIEEAEGIGLCSPKSGRHLRLILDGTFPAALPEFIALLLERKKALPPESVPALLDRCINDADLWGQLQPALGQLGHWLIGQNPAWEHLAPRVDPAEWPEAGMGKRRLILAHWRRQEPTRAMEVLESIWPDLDYKDRAACLRELRTGLSAQDELFLESGLDDGRKPVRREAAALLAQLPDSALQERLFTAATEMLEYDGRHLTIHPPSELSKALQRDGIEKKNTDYPRANRQLSWFFQLIERIPPQRWAQHWERSPADIVQLVGEADRNRNFVRALARASLLHDDKDWLDAVATHWSLEQDEISWSSELGKAVLTGLSAHAVNRLAIRYLERNEHLIDERSLANQLLALGVHAWEDRLALLLVKGFQNWLAGGQSVYRNMWYYKRLLAVAAYHCSPDLIPKFKTGWYTQSRLWGMWEADVEEFMRVLYFRREMRGAM